MPEQVVQISTITIAILHDERGVYRTQRMDLSSRYLMNIHRFHIKHKARARRYVIYSRAMRATISLRACARVHVRTHAHSRTSWRARANRVAANAGESSSSCVVLVGYESSEVPRVRDLVDALRAAMEDSGMDIGMVDVLGVDDAHLGRTIDDIRRGASNPDGGVFQRNDPTAGTRVVMLYGDDAKALMPDLKLEMNEEGFPGAIFGVFTDGLIALPVGAAAASVASAHERYWDLRPTTAADSYTDDDVHFEYNGELDVWDLSRVTTAMAVAMDRADVLDTATRDTGGERLRSDASHVVAIDGVVGEPLRKALLDALTEVGYDHFSETGPPETKWNREMRDGLDDAGGESPPPSWGLTPETLAAMMETDAVRSFRARLAAMYPEYDIRTLPSDALEPDGIPGAWGGSSICSAVGNAAVYGDMFHWHIDMDPSQLDPSAPWVERFGSYVNRERGRPLFVSAMVYLNPGPWPAAFDAETLFLDPGTGTGVFVRPQPGRVVLMDQDILHRVSTPSQIANLPRYSFVLKLCFFPKRVDGPQRMTLIREDWGEPCLFGTAAGHVGGEEIYEDAYDDDCDPTLDDCDLWALGIYTEDFMLSSMDEDEEEDDEEEEP